MLNFRIKGSSFYNPLIIRSQSLIARSIIVLLLAIPYIGCNRVTSGGKGNFAPEDQAPAIRLSDLEGDEHNLSDYQGKVILLNFWASWCAPCLDEMPALERLYKRYQKEGLQLISIAVDDQKEALNGFRDQFGLTFPVLLDEKGEYKRKYRISGYPETFILDRQGRFVFFPDPENGIPTVRVLGPRQWDSPMVAEMIEGFLSK